MGHDTHPSDTPLTVTGRRLCHDARMPWFPPPTRPVRHSVSGECDTVVNLAETHVYLLAHRASHNFATHPEQTAFEPVRQRVKVTVPTEVLIGEYQIAVIECAGQTRYTTLGDKNVSHLEFVPHSDTTAMVLALRLGGKAAVRVGTPSARLDNLPFDTFEPHPADIGDVGLDSGELRSHLVTCLPQVRVRAAIDRVDNFLQDQVVCLWNQPDVSYADGNMWSDVSTRAHQRLLHGFVFFAEWAGAASQSDERRETLISSAISMLEEWHRRYGSSQAQDALMSWHDETTAQRVLGTLSLMEVCGWQISDEAREIVRNVLEPAAAALFTDAFHETGNNHGMFQDFALLAYAVLAPYPSEQQRARMAAKALRRLDSYFASTFTTEGVHVENSPSYHLMAVQYLKQHTETLRILGHPRAKHFQKVLLRAKTYATHAVMPDGMYPPVSDTTQRVIGNSAHARLFEDPSYRCAITAGREGVAPLERTLVLPESGYAVYRSTWGNTEAVYLFFSAAYNANYHKHSDDLSLFLRYHGVDLLCESGPYGYDYKHPYSQYAYSQFSHNSLVVDAKTLPRTDGKFDAVGLVDHQPEDAALDVTGTNARYADVRHTRRVRVLEKGHEIRIIVTDEVLAQQNHDYELLWNLGPEVKSTVVDKGFRLRARGHQLLGARIESATPWEIRRHEGVDKPTPRGWRFPAFGQAVPAQQLSVRFRGTGVTVTTDFTLLSVDSQSSD